jgi:hypothetical protein
MAKVVASLSARISVAVGPPGWMPVVLYQNLSHLAARLRLSPVFWLASTFRDLGVVA